MTNTMFICFHYHCVPRARWILLNGIEYKTGAGLVYNIEDDLPKVGQVTSIYAVNSNKVVFEVDCFESMYIPHFHCYVLRPLLCTMLALVNELRLVNPIHIRTASALPGHHFVILSTLH